MKFSFKINFTIKSEKAHILNNEPDMVYMTNMNATIYMNDGIIAVMAVDNLPCQLPKDSSEDLGEHLIKYIIPILIIYFKYKSAAWRIQPHLCFIFLVRKFNK